MHTGATTSEPAKREEGSRFGIWALGFRVQVLGFRIWGSGFRV